MINLINEQVPNGRIVIFDVQCNNQKLLEYNISGKSENNDYKIRITPLPLMILNNVP